MFVTGTYYLGSLTRWINARPDGGGLGASLHCALSLAAQCIVIGLVCVFATGGRALFVGLLPR